MVIDARETQIFVRPGAERLEQQPFGGSGVDLAAGNPIEQILKFLV